MNIGIVFYSFSGNTRAVCSFLRDGLTRNGHTARMVEIRLQQEEKRFLEQGRAATHRLKPPLAAGMDLSAAGFDAVVFASPVWAFTYAPALRSYLSACGGLDGKKCACFLTCGAQITSGNALKELEGDIAGKGASVIFSVYISGKKAGDTAYLQGRLDPLLKKIA
ncbi:MAG: flavodoxin family protein [Deltaproteobacteria bacterium]